MSTSTQSELEVLERAIEPYRHYEVSVLPLLETGNVLHRFKTKLDSKTDMSPERAALVHHVLKTLRGSEVVHMAGGKMHVFFPDCPFSVATVWLSSNNEGDTAYALSSPSVKNNKHGRYSSGHKIIRTTSLERFAQNLSAHVRPYSIRDLFRITVPTFNALFSEHKRELETAVSDCTYTHFRTYSVPEVMQKEIRSLFKTGRLDALQDTAMYKYMADVTPKEEALSSLIDNQLRSNPDRMFVHVTKDAFGEQLVRAENFGVKSDAVTFTLLDRTDTISCQFTALPETVQGKLAVLSTLPPCQFVDGVGFTVMEGIYYVL